MGFKSGLSPGWLHILVIILSFVLIILYHDLNEILNI